MKKTIMIIGLLVLSILSTVILAQGPRTGMAENPGVDLEGGEITELTQEEINGLLLMVEEEKLARDVYLDLYDKWQLPIFKNIAASEQTHTDAVMRLIDAYGVEDSAISSERGIFVNAELGELYANLVTQGSELLLSALIVGATVEDLDIKDLNELLAQTANEDIILVYGNLRKGSRNHMRAFNKQIANNDGSYEAQYISVEELNEIISSENERGPLLDDDSNVVSNFETQLRVGPMGTMERGARGSQGLGMQDGQGAGAKDGQGVNAQAKQGSGNQYRMSGENGKKYMEAGGRRVNCPLCDNIQEDGNRLNARLSNGKNTEIKVMPDVASNKALKRLKLKNCDENCNIELKEVSVKNQARAAYEVKAQRNSKVFGVFNKRMNVQAQVDAETGDIIDINKPWWAFLATEPEE